VETTRSDQLPPELARVQRLREQVRAAMDRLTQHDELAQLNLTDGDAQMMKGRQGIMPGNKWSASAWRRRRWQTYGTDRLTFPKAIYEKGCDVKPPVV